MKCYLPSQFRVVRKRVAAMMKWRLWDMSVQPYEDEPLAHPSDDEEDIEDDQDGLSPAVLRARFAGETSVNKW